MGWLRNGMSNSEARAALAGSGNSFEDEQILAQVPAWRRSRVRRQAEQARIGGRPDREQALWQSPKWESDYADSLGPNAPLVALDGGRHETTSSAGGWGEDPGETA